MFKIIINGDFMKRCILMIFIIVPIFAYASDKGPGCGTGKVIFEGKKGLGAHLGATCVNGTVNSIVPTHQSFAMTFEVLGCDPSTTVKIEQKQTRFIANNFNDLMNDISKGDGNFLFAYGELLGCQEQYNLFTNELKDNIGTLIKDGEKPKNILINTKSILNESIILKASCKPTV